MLMEPEPFVPSLSHPLFGLGETSNRGAGVRSIPDSDQVEAPSQEEAFSVK
jgi:hypothetical protein